MTTIIEKINQELENRKDRSAWDKGVTVYALELVEELAENIEGGYISADVLTGSAELEKSLLNGANNWKHYSWSGCSLCYDSQIAERLCCPSKLKKTRNGSRRPNSREEWLDVQARALYQAFLRIKSAIRDALATSISSPSESAETVESTNDKNIA